MYFQDDNNKRYCLYSMRKVSNETKFLSHKRKIVLCKEEFFMHRENFVDFIFYIF